MKHRQPRRRTRALGVLGVALTATVILLVLLIPAEQSPETPEEPTTDVPDSAEGLEGWTPLYFEGFETDAALGSFDDVYGREWNGYTGFADTSGRGTYAPNEVLSVHDSLLDYYLHSENGAHLVAAPLPDGYDGQTYGRYSIRFKSDNIPGYKIAFMLWPLSNKWNDGEIDWPEGNLAGKMSPASAQVGTLADGEMSFHSEDRVYSPTDATDWHVATTEWTPGSVKWYWDGVLVTETTIAETVPSLPMRWTLQAETNLEGELISDDTAGHIFVDWVEAWSYTPGTPSS